MKTKAFDEIRDGVVTSLLVIIGKFYGEDLDNVAEKMKGIKYLTF